MKGWLRSWKLCDVSQATVDGVAGWKKRRLKRAAFLIPPGNFFLGAIDSGCRMLGSGWADHEVAVFRRTHDDVARPRRIDETTIWLPHLPGVELREMPEERPILQAFEELGRFHRLGARSVHGDPHAGNFLYDREGDRCRIIDFETALPSGMEAAQGRARDFAILALELPRLGNGATDRYAAWREAYGECGEYCPIDRLFQSPGFRLRQYWQWLGYNPLGSAISRIAERGQT